jgi:S1-C subfamily serine protease
MNNKVKLILTVLIVICILASGGIFFWLSSLNGRIGSLNDDTQAFMTDTTNQFGVINSNIAGMSSELDAFKTETAGEFSNTRDGITGLNTNLNSLKSEIAATFSTTQNSITGINTSVAGLDIGLASLNTQYSESTLNVRQVYDDVIGSVCQIIGDTSTGSGFIYSEDGYIITCWHVIDNQNDINVVLHDGTCKRANVMGSDQNSDVAVLKIYGVSDLEPLSLADSSTLAPGDPVVVIGSPLGIFETVVYGIISRTNGMVYLSGVGWVANLIQYDAAQNPGNNGGPVFNRDGQVIGMADCSSSSGDGIHYAVSSNKVKRVADAIISQGSFDSVKIHGQWTLDNVTPAVAIDRGLDNCFGVIFITSYSTGYSESDIITAVDGITIRDAADFFSYLEEFRSVGDTVTLTIITGYLNQEIQVDAQLISGWIYRDFRTGWVLSWPFPEFFFV